jgi:methylenetetrahydrofolate reductase (NADPH)
LKTFRQALQSAGFSITAELSVQRQTTIDEALRQAGVLAESVDAIQVPWNSDSQGQASPLALAGLLIRQGIDPIPWLDCRDRNRIALQSDLLGLRAIGVTSIILNRGRHSTNGNELKSRPVFDLSCRELVAMANAMNEEEWSGSGNEFVIGTGAAAVAPETDWDAGPLLARASAGARFLQIQPCFDLDLLRQYMQRLVEARITWNYSVIVSLAADPRDRVETCAGQMREIAEIPGVSGFNLLTLGDPEAVIAAIDASGLREGLPPNGVEPRQHQDDHQ